MRAIPGTENITYRKGNKNPYIISYYHHYEALYCGCYPTLIIALMKRDQYTAHRWNKNYIKQDRAKQHPTKDTPTKYIQRLRNNKYRITRRGKYYGTYTTLREAIKMRNKLEANNWTGVPIKKKHKPALPRYITYNTKDQRFIIQRIINKKLTRWGTFKTLREAIQERDLLIQYDWDIDAICDLN